MNAVEYTGIELPVEIREVIEDILDCVAQQEGFDYPVMISVYTADKSEIREINARERGIDKPTDVLSFPALLYNNEYRLLEPIGDADIDPESGAVFLGDVVLCDDIIKEQAREFGHTYLREAAYLTIHSIYHLLGYDHLTPPMKADMRGKEEGILCKLKIPSIQP